MSEEKKDNSLEESKPNLSLRKDKASKTIDKLSLRKDESSKITDKNIGKGSIPFGSMGPQETQPEELQPIVKPEVKPTDSSTSNETSDDAEAESNEE